MPTITVKTTSEPREIETRWLGQFLAVHRPINGKRKRGLWVVSHYRSGLMAATVATNLKAAIRLAKAWDLRFENIDVTNAANWPQREAWRDAIRETETPSIAARFKRQQTKRWLDDEFGTGTETAAVLAAQAGQPIDQAGGAKRVRWRGDWWPLPSDAELQDWSIDSVCGTPDGRSVEPDHPESWLSILGLV